MVTTLRLRSGQVLGSANLMIDASGNASSQRYKPFGEVRTGSVATDLTFTGQRLENKSYVGNLMDYGARMYAPGIGRFISADTIVPGAGNPQSLNRYSYVNNRPLNMVDPTGHDPAGSQNAWNYCGLNCVDTPEGYSVSFSYDNGAKPWTTSEKRTVQQAASAIGKSLLSRLDNMPLPRPSKYQTAHSAFQAVFGHVNFQKVNNNCPEGCYYQVVASDTVFVYSNAKINSTIQSERGIVHELGHVFDRRASGNVAPWKPTGDLAKKQNMDPNFPDRPDVGEADQYVGGFASPVWNWQQSLSGDPWEEFADLFVGWSYGNVFNANPKSGGTQYRQFMSDNMDQWIWAALVVQANNQ